MSGTIGTASFPVIDLRAAVVSGDPEFDDLAARVDAACREFGFFLVHNHGVDQRIVDEVDAATRAFFALPAAVKQQSGGPTPAGWLGYRGEGRTTTARSLDQETPPDLVETFGIKSVEPDNPHSAHNVWPQDARFRAAWTAYSREMVRLQDALLRVLEQALDLPRFWFAPSFDRHFSGLKANYYPAQAVDPLPGQLRRGAHTDYGFMTLLHQDDAPGGLQVETAPGVWADVPHVPGTFVVNVADLLSLWTNGRWTSSMHRVVNPPRDDRGRDRVSIPFFVNPNEDAVVRCVPGCADGSEGPPVVAGPWIAGKIARTTR